MKMLLYVIGWVALAGVMVAAVAPSAGADDDPMPGCCVCDCVVPPARINGLPTGEQFCFDALINECGSLCMAENCDAGAFAEMSCSEVSQCPAIPGTMAPVYSLTGLGVLCLALGFAGWHAVRRKPSI